MAKSVRRSVTHLRTTRPPISPPARDRITVLLDGDLIERVRDAAWHLRLTISDIAGPALDRELVRLQRAHNRGKPFPTRGGPVKTGRPLKPRG